MVVQLYESREDRATRPDRIHPREILRNIIGCLADIHNMIVRNADASLWKNMRCGVHGDDSAHQKGARRARPPLQLNEISHDPPPKYAEPALLSSEAAEQTWLGISEGFIWHYSF